MIEKKKICEWFVEFPDRSLKRNVMGLRCSNPYLEGKRITSCKYFVDDLQCPIWERILIKNGVDKNEHK